jgi:hypothetical protein
MYCIYCKNPPRSVRYFVSSSWLVSTWRWQKCILRPKTIPPQWLTCSNVRQSVIHTTWRTSQSSHHNTSLKFRYLSYKLLRLYSKSSLTLKEWRFNLSFPWVSMLFSTSWRVSSHMVRYDTNPPAIQNQHWHSREVQIEPSLCECECEWAFRIQDYRR